MITADTITSDQLRELAKIYRHADSEIVDLAIDALVELWGMRSGNEARTRCAEIINARNARKAAL